MDQIIAALSNATPPQGIDWRTHNAIPPVYNQEPCDSADVIATVNMVQSAHFIASGKMETLSMQQLNDCINAPGCAGVKPGESLKYISQYGLMRESDYTPDGGKCNYDASRVAVKISSEINVKSMSDTELESALLKAPVLVQVDKDSFDFQSYMSGVLNDGDACGTTLDHSMLAVGWGLENNQKYYILQNSWGKTWGVDGYMKIAAIPGAGICGVQIQPVYVTAS